MKISVKPGLLKGEIPAVASKSDAHRLLICAALADTPTKLKLETSSEDINATIDCLRALGADILWGEGFVMVLPIGKPRPGPVLDCAESGSTFRFLLPVAAAICPRAKFVGRGRLPDRPISHLTDVMKEHGVKFSSEKLPFEIEGRLAGGDYLLPGNVSSQYITGLLLALPKVKGLSTITLTTQLESAAYVDMTLSALRRFGIKVYASGGCYEIEGSQCNISPGTVSVDGDWSNAAFFLAAGAIGRPVTVTGLDVNSPQGDKAIVGILGKFGAYTMISGDRITAVPGNLHGCEIDVGDVPDLLPALSVVAACANGETVFTNASRLRLKESDRLKSVAAMLRSLGGDVTERADCLVVRGTQLTGGTVDSFRDHRITMAAAIAATRCLGDVTITGAEAVGKSYPAFFEDYNALGGKSHVL